MEKEVVIKHYFKFVYNTLLEGKCRTLIIPKLGTFKLNKTYDTKESKANV